ILLNSISVSLAPLMLSTLYGPTVVGWFALAQRVVARPLQVVENSVSQVYIRHAAQLRAERPTELLWFHLKVTAGMFALALPYAGVLVITGPWLFSAIFGDIWHSAGVYTRILAVGILFEIALSPTSHVLSVLRRQDLFLMTEIVRFLVLFLALVT